MLEIDTSKFDQFAMEDLENTVHSLLTRLSDYQNMIQSHHLPIAIRVEEQSSDEAPFYAWRYEK